MRLRLLRRNGAELYRDVRVGFEFAEAIVSNVSSASGVPLVSVECLIHETVHG